MTTGSRDEHDADDVFQAFVRNANAEGSLSRTVRASSAPPPQPRSNPAPPFAPLRPQSAPPPRAPRSVPPGAVWKPSVLPPVLEDAESEATQMREASSVVPEVARISAPSAPIPEGSEDGQVPAGALDRMLVDMAVLVRYGHVDESRKRLDAFVSLYPDDLLLLRRVSEFYVEHGRPDAAAAFLYALASSLFARGNHVGVRRTLEQVRVLLPEDARTARIFALLDRGELRLEHLCE